MELKQAKEESLTKWYTILLGVYAHKDGMLLDNDMMKMFDAKCGLCEYSRNTRNEADCHLCPLPKRFCDNSGHNSRDYLNSYHTLWFRMMRKLPSLPVKDVLAMIQAIEEIEV